LKQKTRIVVFTDSCDPRWRWIENRLSGQDIEFEFVRCVVTAFSRRFDTSHFTGSMRALLLARRASASAVVVHGPTNAAWYGLLSRLLRVRIPILAHTFNFIHFPSPAMRRVLSFAYRLANIRRFVVYSTMERELYANAFDIPAQLFDIVIWGTNPPAISTPGTPAEAGDYVCAIGGNGRDYRTLFEAARRLPHIRFVVVLRPENLRALEVPSNVIVRTNDPFEVAMNVLFYSKFMVLPLLGTEVPYGHVTIVCAMHLSKAYVITDSAGVRDYAKDQINSLTVEHGSVDELVAAVVRLWKDPELCARLGENGHRFAAAECTEGRIAQHFCGWLQDNHIGHLG
jgi:glycosyltransferase involved in cell wall biosynthesis